MLNVNNQPGVIASTHASSPSGKPRHPSGQSCCSTLVISILSSGTAMDSLIKFWTFKATSGGKTFSRAGSTWVAGGFAWLLPQALRTTLESSNVNTKVLDLGILRTN